MPKKLNSIGHDQEYIPAGNGDASGEYADEQGGNRHFDAFKNPKTSLEKKASKIQNPTKEQKERVDKIVALYNDRFGGIARKDAQGIVWRQTGRTMQMPDGATLYAMESEDGGIQWFDKNQLGAMEDLGMYEEYIQKLINPKPKKKHQ